MGGCARHCRTGERGFKSSMREKGERRERSKNHLTRWLGTGFTIIIRERFPVTGLTSGELAKRSSVNLQTIRYYEQQGLLPTPPRTQSGYRSFPADTVHRIRFIKRAQELGFQLDEIRELLSLRIDPSTTCAEVRRHAEAKIEDVNARIQRLRAMKKALTRLAAACSGRVPVGECPILESLDSKEVL